MKLIYSEDEELKLKASNIGLIGIGYRFVLPKEIQIIPVYGVNVGEFEGHQMSLEVKVPMLNPSLELMVRGEKNLFEQDSFQSSTSQLTLLLGLIF
jgi:hypothetical protein